MGRHVVARLVAGLLLWVSQASGQPFDPGRATFAARFGDFEISYGVLAVSAAPGSDTPIRASAAGESGFSLSATGGALRQEGAAAWTWTAPDVPGHHQLVLARQDGASVTLQVFVLRPAAEVRDGFLNGYRMGHYPELPLDGNAIYTAPTGFVEVTADLADLPISPHFRLAQFFCKQQPDDWPKYLVLRTELLVKLETLLEAVNRRGIHADTFHVMSGYRTPWYNQAIGNVAFSRHLWGGAADIFIDNDGDGVMDDLNGDGRLDIHDAVVLQGIARELSDNGVWRRLLGGLGLYGPRIHRGAFVHVDARGRKARWEVP